VTSALLCLSGKAPSTEAAPRGDVATTKTREREGGTTECRPHQGASAPERQRKSYSFLLFLTSLLLLQFSKEKERLLQETATQRQRIESEVDELRSEHLQTVSALKAETATKLRQLKAEERQRIEEALGQFRREKEELEADYAAEMDRTLQQHKASLTKLKVSSLLWMMCG
jgi:hypothetical protein